MFYETVTEKPTTTFEFILVVCVRDQDFVKGYLSAVAICIVILYSS